MNEDQVRESIIVAECGRTLTRATLVEFVEGACRFVAQGTSPSTIERPYDDLNVGLRGALAALERATTRRFADRSRVIRPQEENGDGTDAFLATVAAGPPLRIAIVATGTSARLDALLAIARRVPATILPTLVVESVGPLDDATRKTVAALAGLRPDLLLIVADAREGAGLVHLLGLATEIVGPPPAGTDSPPAVLVLASEAGRDRATRIFGEGYEFGFLPTDQHDASDIALIVETEILDLVNRRAGALVPGFENVAEMSDAPPLARSRAIDLVNRFMATRFGCAVLTVDLDEGFTCCWARGGEGRALTEPALDLALGAANMLTALALPDVARWLPFTLAEDALRGWILNRAVRPFTIPMGERDRQIEGALVRELLRIGATELASGGSGPLAPELVVGGPFFARWPDPTDAFMALIDGLDPQPPRGIAQIALDRDALLPLIGTLGTLEPERAAELFEHDSLFDLGACVRLDCPAGERVEAAISYRDGRTLSFTVEGDGLARLPLPAGERAATLRLSPSRGARIGDGEAGATVILAGDEAPHGGPVGLVLDARERPLAFPRGEQARIARVAGWHTAAQAVARPIGVGRPPEPDHTGTDTPGDIPRTDPDEGGR
jgi:hypothetical protein